MRIRTIDDFTAAEINAMPKSARPIGRRKVSEAEKRTLYARCVRHGKTARERGRKPRSQKVTP